MEILKNKKEIKQTIDFVRIRLFPGQKPGSNIILKRLLCFSMLILLSSAGFATGGIAKLILQAREQGSIFEPVNDLLIANTTYSSPAIEREVVNPKYFDFNNLVALDLIQNRKQYISITLPGVSATGGDLVVDLIASPEANYDFRIKTSSGLEYSGKDLNLVHYRGVVRTYESQSLVFLSISDDDVSMDISIKYVAEFEIYKDDTENIHVFHNYIDIANIAELSTCGGYDEVPLAPSGVPPVNKAAASNKCLYLFMEVEYEVFLEAGSDIEELQERVLKTFNKTQSLYEDIEVTLRLRELKLWDTPDPYTYTAVTIPGNQATNQADFAAKKLDYYNNASIPSDVNLAHLLTTYASGGVLGTGGGFRCVGGDGVPWPSIERFSGACDNNSCRRILIQTMAHEIGHSLSSGHTRDCHWNGNCTPLDNEGCCMTNTVCNGVSVGPCGSAPNPSDGQYTVMGALYLIYHKGFGEQPGNKIEDFVNSQACLSSCDVSCNDLPNIINVGILQDVHSGEDDYRHSEIATNAYNEIEAGGDAGYYSATQVFLKPGFKAHYGSDFNAAIKPCIYYADERSMSGSDPNSDEEDRYITDGGFTIQAYPNPTTGKLVVELNGSSIYSISVVNLMGIPIFEQLNVSLSRIELDISDKAKGLYFIQVKSQDNKVERIKLILQ